MDIDDVLLTDCVRAVLSRHDAHDWRLSPGESWCAVRPGAARARTQGWKLHVSATPLSAPLVLARSADVLVRHRCPFKFAATLSRVEELVSRACDRSAGGKFITAYPDCDDELLAIAAELDQATEGLPGPAILSDRPYRPTSLVHYRFGAFTGIRMLGNDGSYDALLVAPDGSLVLDRREPWFAAPSWAPPDPFTREHAGPPPVSRHAKPVLLDDRYVVHEAIRHSFSGGVFRATDRTSGAQVVIKQGRPHTGAGLTGQDVRDRRRHEAAMLELLSASGRTPAPVGLFEQQGDLFGVQERIDGVTLRRWVADNIELDDGRSWGHPPSTVTRLAGGLVGLMESVHGKGLVIRDFNPTNVMVTEDGDLRLIDLEMLARPGELRTRGHTPGYAAPEQVSTPKVGAAPELTADLYSLGATLFHLVSGADPVLPPDEPVQRSHQERIRTWLAHLSVDNGGARRLSPIIVELLHDDPQRRPGLAAVRAFLAGQADPGPEVAAPARQIADADLRRMIADATGHLLAGMDQDGDQRRWSSGRYGTTSDPLNIQHGAAGVLGVLTDVYRTEPDPLRREAVTSTARWISDRLCREPRVLPGLYFGRAGTALALLAAGQAVGDEELVGRAVDLAKRVPVHWPNPDVCHGTAGSGLVQLRFWEATGQDDFLRRARQAADSVVAAAEYRDGTVRWPIPRDFASVMAGVVHYGFAHGVAGIGAFLLAAAQTTGEHAYRDLAAAAADTLVSVADVDRGAAYWTSKPGGGARRTNWCSGSSGVGTFLARMWQENGGRRYAELAAQAAVAVRRSRWHAGTAQCHGLAGDGEFLLDLAQALATPRYRDWAAELAVNIQVRNTFRDGRMVVADDTGTAVVADFNTGLSGVLAFLLRLRDGGPRLWLGPAAGDAAPRRLAEGSPVHSTGGNTKRGRARL